MYWQYTTALAVSVAAAMNPIVRKANDATAILIFIFFSHGLAKFFAIVKARVSLFGEAHRLYQRRLQFGDYALGYPHLTFVYDEDVGLDQNQIRLMRLSAGSYSDQVPHVALARG